jgi:hypothetical protein
MPATPGPSSPAAIDDTPRAYPPVFVTLLQSLLATLADIDLAHEGDVETIRNSGAEEWLKQTVIRRRGEAHRRRRAPYVRQLEVLEARIRGVAA